MTKEVYERFPHLSELFEAFPNIERPFMFGLPIRRTDIDYLYGYLDSLHDMGELLSEFYRECVYELKRYEKPNEGGRAHEDG